ncbi:restriction endonuclease subunit S [Pseudomonas sp. SD17-1]|uniref:restriction endonuclease subunit S n=1 Tax=Pseudomonas sp. SD17-1 TaxID=2976883 RepID=UPI0023DBB9E6|nr:restriction endonuclease subunit S [Pseudomonas sp. SD17-1]WEJ21026.1 restriction endonuclease subunit S [Pseudomonas sp. SD17-1]
MSQHKPYPTYKDSGVEWLGRVPEHWRVVRMRYAATLNPPVRRDLLENPDQKVSFLPMEAIGEEGSLNLEQARAVTEVRNGYSYFEDGDVAFAKVTPCFENGKGALMRGLQSAAGFGTTELTVLRPNPAAADARYLNYIVQSSSFRCFGVGAMTGAGGLKRVPDEFTRNFPVSLPELDEQRVIAAHLDRETSRMDALIEKKTRFIELLREKRQALITHAVNKGFDSNVKMKDSGLEWLGEVPQHWQVVRMRYAVTLNPSVRHDLLKDPEQHVSFLPMEAIGEDGSLSLEQVRPVADVRNGYSYFEDGDVVFAKVTPCFENGKGALMRGLKRAAGFGTTELTVLRPNSAADANYLSYVVQSSSFRAFGTGAMTGAGGLKRVPDEFTRNFPVPLPVPREQCAIVARLERETIRIDALKQKTEYSIALLKERRSALISAAVTGQVDLRSAL